MYDISKNLAPKDDGKGVVDYKNLGFVRNIVTDSIIANITPPSHGEPGRDVLGNEIPARDGLPAKFRLGKNTKFSDDELNILAAVDGNLEWDGASFHVAETLVITQDVGPATGNIDFIGSVLVRGSVDENFTIISKKDVQVNGTVVGATVIADGNVTVNLGVIKTNITAKGDVTVNFCENAKIECEGNLRSSSCIMCNIFCGGMLEVTSGKGVIAGGQITAIGGIHANTIGSQSFIHTKLTLGKGAILAAERDSLIKKHEEITEQITRLEQAGILLSAQKKRQGGVLPPDKEALLVQATRNRFTFMRENKQYEARIDNIQRAIAEDSNVEVSAKRDFWNNVAVSIGTRHAETKTHYVNHKAYLDLQSTGDIIFVPNTSR
jgi:uncharacterized protein (DUF342 family)